MKHIVCIVTSTLFAIAFAIEIPVYSHKKSDKDLHVKAESKDGDILGVWNFPSSYTGKRSVVDIPVSDTNANFYAWVGDDDFKPGDPFGVSNCRDYNAIELSETSPIFVRINLLTGETDREIVYGKGSESVIRVPCDTIANSVKSCQKAKSKIEGMKKVRVRIDRFGIKTHQDGMACLLGFGADDVFFPPRVLVDKIIDLEQKSVLHEGDILDKDVLDIDWKYNKSEILSSRSAQVWNLEKGLSVLYRIVIGDDDFIHPTAMTNSMLSCVFARKFGGKHTSPRELSSSILNHKPIFNWSMYDDESWVAFKIVIIQDGDEIFSSEILRAPPRDNRGFYTWNAPLTLPNGRYTWKVSVYNALYKDNEETLRDVQVGSGWSDNAYLTID